MAEITASMVKELREGTGAGMMECKKALVEAEGDMESAVDILRTRGLAALAKKAGRATNEGAIACFVSEDGKTGALVELNCETDFVARNATFVDLVTLLAKHVVENAPADVEALKDVTVAGRDITVQELLGEAVGKLGENMGIARFERVAVDGEGFVQPYIHGGGKIGVMVRFSFTKPETAAADTFMTFAKDVAMQVAAAAPIVARRDEIDADVVEHERAIYKAQAAESGKPEPIQEKMAEGRLEKFFKEVVLVEQVFVKDDKKTIGGLTAEVSKAVGDEVTVDCFTRMLLGETAAADAAE